MRRWILVCGALALLLAATSARSQSCTVIVNNLSSTTAYDPFSSTNNDTQGGILLTCTRAPSDQKFPANFWVGVGTGAACAGSAGRLKSGTSDCLTYALYQNYSTCSSAWGGTTGILLANSNTKGSDTVTNPSPESASFCFRINALQTTAKPSSPSYTDTLTVEVRSTNNAGYLWGGTSFTLSTNVNAACSFTTPPGSLVINYTSFSTTASTGTSNFALRCTNSTPYTLALDQTSVTDNALNLAYTLALSASSGTGSGVAQSYTITGTMAVGQAGTCASASCTNNAATNKSRTLTVTY